MTTSCIELSILCSFFLLAEALTASESLAALAAAFSSCSAALLTSRGRATGEAANDLALAFALRCSLRALPSAGAWLGSKPAALSCSLAARCRSLRVTGATKVLCTLTAGLRPYTPSPSDRREYLIAGLLDAPALAFPDGGVVLLTREAWSACLHSS